MWLGYVSLVILILGAFTFLVLPKGRWKVTGTMTFLLLSTVVYAGAFEIVGLPKPYLLEWRKLNGLPIIGMYQKEEEPLYIILLRDGEPVTYTFPWDGEVAESLNNQWREASFHGQPPLFSMDGGEIELRKPPDGRPPK